MFWVGLYSLDLGCKMVWKRTLMAGNTVRDSSRLKGKHLYVTVISDDGINDLRTIKHHSTHNLTLPSITTSLNTSIQGQNPTLKNFTKTQSRVKSAINICHFFNNFQTWILIFAIIWSMSWWKFGKKFVEHFISIHGITAWAFVVLVTIYHQCSDRKIPRV